MPFKIKVNRLLSVLAIFNALVFISVLVPVASGELVETSHNFCDNSSSFKIALGKIPGYAIIKFEDSDIAYLCETKFYHRYEKSLYKIHPQYVKFRPITHFYFSHRLEAIQSLFVCPLGEVKRVQRTNIFNYDKYSIYMTISGGKYNDVADSVFEVLAPRVEINEVAFLEQLFGSNSGRYMMAPSRYVNCSPRYKQNGVIAPMMYSSPPLLLHRHSIAKNYAATQINKHTPKIYKYHKITNLNYCFYNSFYHNNTIWWSEQMLSEYFLWCILRKYTDL